MRCKPSSTSEAVVSVIRHFKWSRVAIVHEYDPDLFSPVSNYVRNDVLNAGFQVITIEGVRKDGSYSFAEQMIKIKERDTRIVIGLFYHEAAFKVFCEAYMQGFYGPRYVWLLMDTLGARWWENTYFIKYSNCTKEQLELAAGNYLTIGNIILRSDYNKTISGMTGIDFLWSLYNRTNGYYYTPASYTYDSTWAVALALDKVAHRLDLKNYQYSNITQADLINSAFKKVKFEGLTGTVAFNKYGERIGTMTVQQNRNGTIYEIAQYVVADDELIMTPSQVEKIWEENGGRVPTDRTIEKREVQVLPLGLLIVMWLLSCLGMISSVVILYINIRNRELRLIKMSSPTFNNVILVGGVLCYVSVILLGIDTRFLSYESYGILCNVRAWTMGLGFTLAFGAMFSKTWRVHRIFTAARTLKKKSIRDVHLFGLLFGLLVVEVTILVVWMIASPFSFKITELDHMEDKEQDIVLVPLLVQCSSKLQTQFLLGMYTYKGVLLLFGLFLAWETRKIQIPVLNDSKYIGMSVYNVVVLSAVGITISTILEGSHQNTTLYALTSACIITGTTVTLFLVFIPKLIAMRSVDAMEKETNNPTIMTSRLPTVTSTTEACHRCRTCPCKAQAK